MLKIMSLNINGYGERYGSWETRRRLIENEIELAGPDIIALQAVQEDPSAFDGLNQARQLANLFPEYPFVVYQAANIQPQGGSDGPALISCLQFAETDALPLTLLPDLEDTNQRRLLMARFNLPAGPFYIFNAHFSWVPAQTQLNAEEALAYLERFSGPALLVGDLNATPDSPAMEGFRQAGWIDVWDALNPGQAGYTFMEGGRLSKRIDYAWANAQLRPQVRSIKIVANLEEVSSVRPSDHAGLLVTLDLEKPASAPEELYP